MLWKGYLAFCILVTSTRSVDSRRRVINYVPPVHKNITPTPPVHQLLSGNLEDILETPQFRDRAPNIAQDPDVWGDALAAYEKLLKNRGKQVDPHGEPIGYVKPGLFSPWVNPVVDHSVIWMGGATTTKKTPKIVVQPHKPTIDGHTHIFNVPHGRTEEDESVPEEVMTVHERLLDSAVMTQGMMYRKCGGSHPRGKVCYGVPSGCVEARMCRLIVTLGYDDMQPKYVTVHLAGEAVRHGFIAVAFSHDYFVGSDVVIYCISVDTEEGPKVALYFSYTENYRSFMQKDRFIYKANVSPNFGFRKGGVMACSFNLSTIVSLDDGSAVDILDDPFYLMLAFGHYIHTLPVNHSDFGSIKYQHMVEFSRIPVILNEALRHPEIIYPRSHKLILFHVLPSVVAFLFLLPSSTIIAKYGKEVYGYPVSILGRFHIPLWLFIHLITIFLSVPLIIWSIISILIELDFSWRSGSSREVLHAALGTLAILLATLGLLSGFWFRLKATCSQTLEESSRWLSWVHWGVGNLAYLIGLYCVLGAASMGKAHAPCFVEYFGYLHFALHVLTHGVMSYDTYKLGKEIDKRFSCRRTFFGPLIPWTRADSPQWSTGPPDDFHQSPLWYWRRRAIVFHFIVSFLSAFTISILMLFPTVLCR